MRLVDPLSGSEWDRLIQRHPDANFFHSTAWARILAECYGHRPFYLSFSRDEQSVALLPLMEVRSAFTGRRGVCLPFSDFCGPLFFDEAAVSTVFNSLAGLAQEQRWHHFEIRDGRPGQLAPLPAVRFYGHKLNLNQSAETLFAGCSSPVRRAIRKAEKSGLRVEISRSWDSVLAFYRLHIRTRRRHGLPPQPLSFFRNIFAEAIEPGSAFIVRADSGGRCVAAALFLEFGRIAVFKFGASDYSQQHLRGSNLVMWEGIRYLAGRRCELLHFGRTSLNNGTLRRFKLGWGAQEEIIEYFKWNSAAGKWVGGADHAEGRYNAIFSRLPLAVNRLAGALLYPHLD